MENNPHADLWKEEVFTTGKENRCEHTVSLPSTDCVSIHPVQSLHGPPVNFSLDFRR